MLPMKSFTLCFRYHVQIGSINIVGPTPGPLTCQASKLTISLNRGPVIILFINLGVFKALGLSLRVVSLVILFSK